jgi:hypothetical protein
VSAPRHSTRKPGGNAAAAAETSRVSGLPRSEWDLDRTASAAEGRQGVSPCGTGDERAPRFVLTLEWRCATCGWATVVDTPGFGGDGYEHFEQPGNVPCGPLVARRVRRSPVCPIRGTGA